MFETEATCIYCDNPIDSPVFHGGDAFHSDCLQKLNEEIHSVVCPRCKGTKRSLFAQDYDCLCCKGKGRVAEEVYEKLVVSRKRRTV